MKSHASDSPLEVVAHVLLDSAAMCSVDIASINRDLDTVRSRVNMEGFSFLTITLPAFGSALEMALTRGQVLRSDFPGFRRRRGLPAFLQGFLQLLFDAETGILLDDAACEAILAVRQICYTFKKVLMPCTSSRERRAVEDYIQIERDLEQLQVPTDALAEFDQVSNVLWTKMFADAEEIHTADLLPKHGPGATEERIMGNQKFAIRSWHDRLEPYFPLDAYGFASVNHMDDETEGLDSVTAVPPEAEAPVRVCLVPKTLKSPRVIAIEPVCMQYAQQALLHYLVPRLEGSRPTAGHVNFTNQSINRELARESSKTQRLATLDMSAASDRVPRDIALRMFQGVPTLAGALDACRSRTAILPDGRVIALRKFASMGSAVCFPVEAMYFFTVVLCALHRWRAIPVTEKSVHVLARSVYVYGDDILVPVAAAEVVCRHLAVFGCKVNLSKSFWTGKFRESCGLDAYCGEDVTPTYVRRLAPAHKRDASAIVSWVETANLFYRRGFWRTAAFLVKTVESLLGKLPIKRDDEPGLGLVSYQRIVSWKTWNKDLQCPSRPCYVVTTADKDDRLDGYPALLKFFLRQSGKPDRLGFLKPMTTKEDHLARSARFGTVSIKRRKVPVS